MAPSALNVEEIKRQKKNLHPDWQMGEDGKSLTRKFTTKGFNQALAITNLCATIADENNHHPDICLGWGYCHVSFTTHSASALTVLDFDCAKALDERCDSLVNKT